MNPEFYRRAMSGDPWEHIQGLCTDFQTQKTPNGNTILHVLAESSDSFAGAVEAIAEGERDLVYMKNKEGETPLVIASRKGHYNLVRALIDSATRASSSSGHKRTQALWNMYRTAALEALRNNAREVAKLLLVEGGNPVEGGTRDYVRQWMYIFFPWMYIFSASYASDPLYLAVEKGYDDIVDLILSTNLTTHYCGPLGRTPLHTAALSNYPSCMEHILTRLPRITKKVDMLGWNAIHYASMLNRTDSVRLLLSTDNSLGYLFNSDKWLTATRYFLYTHGMPTGFLASFLIGLFSADKDDSRLTALHIAVCWGHVNVVREILVHCPDCWEMTTFRKRKNILHLAVENERQQVLDFILETSWGPGLINKEDGEGNTPLHLYVSTNNLDGNKLVNHPCTHMDATNNYFSTPLDIIEDIIEDADVVTERQNRIKNELLNAGATPQLQRPRDPLNLKNVNASGKRENMESYAVVAALIVTVTFAAGFTIPGGYQNTAGMEGKAALSKDAAFIVFIISDSLAMMVGVLALLQHFLFATKNKRFLKTFPRQNLTVVAFFITLSVGFMVIAFLTGLYAVLPAQVLKFYLIVVGSVLGAPIPLYVLFTYIYLDDELIHLR